MWSNKKVKRERSQEVNGTARWIRYDTYIYLVAVAVAVAGRPVWPIVHLSIGLA